MSDKSQTLRAWQTPPTIVLRGRVAEGDDPGVAAPTRDRKPALLSPKSTRTLARGDVGEDDDASLAVGRPVRPLPHKKASGEVPPGPQLGSSTAAIDVRAANVDHEMNRAERLAKEKKQKQKQARKSPDQRDRKKGKEIWCHSL